MESNMGISKELRNILKEPDTDKFLLKLQKHLLTNTNESQRRANKKYSQDFYRNLPLLDRRINELSTQEKRLLKVKVNSLTVYLEDINKISFPSPFIIGVFTAVISLILGIMIKEPSAFPKWTIAMVIGCFVLFIPAISWFTLDQSGKNAELKEILATVKEMV